MSEDAGAGADDHALMPSADEEGQVTGAGDLEPDTECDDEGPGTWPTSMPHPGRRDPMVWIAIVLIVFLILLLLFANVPKIRASAGSTMASQEWELVTYVDATGIMVPVLANTTVTFGFPKNGIADGRSGCSYYAVNYSTTDYSIALSDLVIADILCWDPNAAEQEEAYLLDLMNCTGFRVSKTSLKMYGNEGRELLVFVPRT